MSRVGCCPSIAIQTSIVLLILLNRHKMACSAVSLSVATIISIVAVACLAIAFSTDNWYEIRVDRNKTKLYYEPNAIPYEFDNDLRFFSRDEGLFRICFAEKKPKSCKYYCYCLAFICLMRTIENVTNCFTVRIN